MSLPLSGKALVRLFRQGVHTICGALAETPGPTRPITLTGEGLGDAAGGIVLRIHFTAEDCGRVRVAGAADPLWEMVFSRRRLREADAGSVFQPWTRWIREHVEAGAIRPGLRVLTTLSPLGPYFPDFLTPTEGTYGLGPAIEAIRATPRGRLRHELDRLSVHRPLPSWTRLLADGDSGMLADVASALTAYHRTAVEPYSPAIDSAIHADRAYRARALLDGGVAGLLQSMRPLMQWRPPVLEVQYPVHRDLRLDGRGLRLVPSYFCRRLPVALADPDLPPTLVYPVHQDVGEPSGRATEALSALLGATRYAVLAAIGHGASTTELATLLDVAPSSISRHTTVLRQAGILTTHRHGPSVLHTITPLGTALLRRGTTG
jgi:DNA-binding transcriptional ArsR family regulator